MNIRIHCDDKKHIDKPESGGILRLRIRLDGGPGSGNWGHEGRPGKIGGSVGGGGKQHRKGTKESGFTSEAKERKASHGKGATSVGTGGESYANYRKTISSKRDEMRMLDIEKDATWNALDDLEREQYTSGRELNRFLKNYDIAKGQTREEVEEEIASIEKRTKEVDEMVDKYYSDRPERGTEEYKQWKELRKQVQENGIIEEQMQLSTELVEKKSQLRAIDYLEQHSYEEVMGKVNDSLQKEQELTKKLYDIEQQKNSLRDEIDNMVLERLKSPDDFVDVDDATDYIRAKRYFKTEELESGYHSIEGEVFSHNDKVDLTGCDLESAKTIASATDHIFTECPELSGKLTGISADNFNDDGVYAHAVGTNVEVNTQFFDNAASCRKSYDSDVDSGFHPVGTTYESLIYHEYAHAIDHYLSYELGSYGFESNGNPVKPSTVIPETIASRYGITVSDMKTFISGYSLDGKGNEELIAECMAEYFGSSSPRELACVISEELIQKLKGGD